MQIKDFPNLRQAHEYDCGATALQSVLLYYGINERLEKVTKLAGTTKTGTSIHAMKKVVEKYGLKADMSEMKITDVKKYLDRKIPVILLLQAWSGKEKNDWKNDW